MPTPPTPKLSSSVRRLRRARLILIGLVVVAGGALGPAQASMSARAVYSDLDRRTALTATSPQLIARTNEGFEVVPSANGRSAVLTELNATTNSTSVYLWRAHHPGLRLITRQPLRSSLTGLGVSTDGSTVAYRCAPNIVCLWQARQGVIRRISLRCGSIVEGGQPGFGHVSADLQTIVFNCETPPPGERTLAPLIVRHGHLLPTKRLTGYFPIGVSDDGRTVILARPPSATYVYAAGHLRKVPGLGIATAVSHNGRFLVGHSGFVGPYGLTNKYLIYDRTIGRSRIWTPPPVTSDSTSTPGGTGPAEVTAISNSGQALVYDDSFGTLDIVDLRTGQITSIATDVTRTFAPHFGLSADGQTLFYEQHRKPSEIFVRQLSSPL